MNVTVLLSAYLFLGLKQNNAVISTTFVPVVRTVFLKRRKKKHSRLQRFKKERFQLWVLMDSKYQTRD